MMGIINFRDLSETVSGNIQSKLLFRSSDLHNITINDISYVQTLGVGQVIDFRTDEEIYVATDILPAEIKIIHLNVLQDSAAPYRDTSQFLTQLTNFATPDATSQVIQRIDNEFGEGRAFSAMLTIYEQMVSLPSAQKAYGAFLQLLKTLDQPLIFHCSAGKDRTGWATVLVQKLLGVSDDEIIATYLESNSAWKTTYDALLAGYEKSGGNPDVLADFLWVRQEYLEHAFHVIQRNFDSFDKYIQFALGISTDVKQQIRQQLSTK